MELGAHLPFRHLSQPGVQAESDNASVQIPCHKGAREAHLFAYASSHPTCALLQVESTNTKLGDVRGGRSLPSWLSLPCPACLYALPAAQPRLPCPACLVYRAAEGFRLAEPGMVTHHSAPCPALALQVPPYLHLLRPVAKLQAVATDGEIKMEQVGGT